MEERIRELAGASGMTQKEALVYWCLSKTEEYLRDLPDLTFTEKTAINQHCAALLGLLSTRVAARDHPEGYRRD